MDEETKQELIRTATFAADPVFLSTAGTNAAKVRAAITASLECLIGNGMITVTAREEWPEWIKIDPPYGKEG